MKVLSRDEYTKLKGEVESKAKWKIGKYTYETADENFYLWALHQTNQSKSLIQFIEWYHLNKYFKKCVDGGD